MLAALISIASLMLSSHAMLYALQRPSAPTQLQYQPSASLSLASPKPWSPLMHHRRFHSIVTRASRKDETSDELSTKINKKYSELHAASTLFLDRATWFVTGMMAIAKAIYKKSALYRVQEQLVDPVIQNILHLHAIVSSVLDHLVFETANYFVEREKLHIFAILKEMIAFDKFNSSKFQGNAEPEFCIALTYHLMILKDAFPSFRINIQSFLNQFPKYHHYLLDCLDDAMVESYLQKPLTALDFLQVYRFFYYTSSNHDHTRFDATVRNVVSSLFSSSPLSATFLVNEAWTDDHHFLSRAFSKSVSQYSRFQSDRSVLASLLRHVSLQLLTMESQERHRRFSKGKNESESVMIIGNEPPVSKNKNRNSGREGEGVMLEDVVRNLRENGIVLVKDTKTRTLVWVYKDMFIVRAFEKRFEKLQGNLYSLVSDKLDDDADEMVWVE